MLPVCCLGKLAALTRTHLFIPSQAFNYQMFNQSQYLYPADIGHLLYSMAYIKAKPNRDQLARMLRSLKSNIDRATGDDIANVLLALAEFEYTPM